MLAFSDVLNLFPYELSSLRGRGFTFAGIAPSALDGF
jgi:hypothetical protein